MNLNDYQGKALRTAIYPGMGTVDGLLYVSLGLAGEAGEVANKVKKILRDDGRRITIPRRREIASELGDVLWYTAMTAHELNEWIGSISYQNIDKLAQRMEDDMLRGSGDSR